MYGKLHFGDSKSAEKSMGYELYLWRAGRERCVKVTLFRLSNCIG